MSLEIGTQHSHHTTALIVTRCTCGTPFAIPDWLENRCRADHNQNFYCPACRATLQPATVVGENA